MILCKHNESVQVSILRAAVCKESKRETKTERKMKMGEREREEREEREVRERKETLTELSRTPLPSVSYSRNMTATKREIRDPMMTQTPVRQ